MTSSLTPFDPERHNANTLSAAVAELPPSLIVAGSLGRSILLAARKPLQRKDGCPVDIDVIDLTGKNREIQQGMIGSFVLDAGLTNYVRPLDVCAESGDWGVFLPEVDDEEPQFTLPYEICAPVQKTLPWSENQTVTIAPPQIQIVLADISGKSYKNRPQHKALRHWADTNGVALPPDVQAHFAAFHKRREQHEKEVFSRQERAYRKVRKMYKGLAPTSVQVTVEKLAGGTIRKVRGTVIDQTEQIR